MNIKQITKIRKIHKQQNSRVLLLSFALNVHTRIVFTVFHLFIFVRLLNDVFIFQMSKMQCSLIGATENHPGASRVVADFA